MSCWPRATCSRAWIWTGGRPRLDADGLAAALRVPRPVHQKCCWCCAPPVRLTWAWKGRRDSRRRRRRQVRDQRDGPWQGHACRPRLDEEPRSREHPLVLRITSLESMVRSGRGHRPRCGAALPRRSWLGRDSYKSVSNRMEYHHPAPQLATIRQNGRQRPATPDTLHRCWKVLVTTACGTAHPERCGPAGGHPYRCAQGAWCEIARATLAASSCGPSWRKRGTA